MEKRQRGHPTSFETGEQNNDGENHRGRTDDCGTNQHRLGSRLKGVTGAVILFQVVLCLVELREEAEVPSNFSLDVGYGLDEREFVDRLRVVRDRSVGVNGDSDRTHTQKAEGYQTESEHRRRV